MTDDLAARRDATEHARRILYAVSTLDMGTTDQLVDVTWVNGDVWDTPAMITGAGEHYTLGFTAPYLQDRRLLVFACAEVLVAAAADLNKDEFFVYIQSVVTHLHVHILASEGANLAGDLEPAVREQHARRTPEHFAIYDRVLRQAERHP